MRACVCVLRCAFHLKWWREDVTQSCFEKKKMDYSSQLQKASSNINEFHSIFSISLSQQKRIFHMGILYMCRSCKTKQKMRYENKFIPKKERFYECITSEIYILCITYFIVTVIFQSKWQRKNKEHIARFERALNLSPVLLLISLAPFKWRHTQKTFLLWLEQCKFGIRWSVFWNINFLQNFHRATKTAAPPPSPTTVATKIVLHSMVWWK